MIENNPLQYFLFPHLTLSEAEFRKFFVFLPRLDLFEISGKAHIPEWAREKFCGRPTIRQEALASRVASCIREYRAFSDVHGGSGGTLGYLSQILNEMETPRYIRQELRGKSTTLDEAEKELLQAAVFLEMARELDEKELELESSYERLSAVESQFRGILGISEEDEEEAVETGFGTPLTPDRAGLLFMLSNRIGSWFRLFSFQQVETLPVFTASYPEIMEETMEHDRQRMRARRQRLLSVTFPARIVSRLGHAWAQTVSLPYRSARDFRASALIPQHTRILHP